MSIRSCMCGRTNVKDSGGMQHVGENQVLDQEESTQDALQGVLREMSVL